MEKYNLDTFIKGWIVGNFSPSLFKSSECEVGVKFYSAGEIEASHYQNIATEITVVISGEIRIGNQIGKSKDIIVVKPKEIADFKSISESVLVCIKFPSIPTDKILN